MTPTKTPRFARALAPLFAATALVSIPAFAQDATPQTAQPVVTPPQTATVPIPPVVRTVPDGATAAAPDATAEPTATPAPRAARSTTTRSTATRTVTRTPAPVKAAPAPVAAAPAPQPAAAPAPVAETAPAPEAAPALAPVTDTALDDGAKSAATTQTTTTSGGIPTWALVAGAIAALAIIIGAIAALRRRREDEEVYYDEPTSVEEPYVAPVAAAPVAEPVVAAAPIAAAPRKEPEYLRATEPVTEIEPVAAAADDVEVSKVSESEIAELTGGTAPVAQRPWLEFAMRPVRAGTNVDEALVEIELTVGNAGSVPAKDVRISTFLLSSDPNGTEMERLLVRPPEEATTDPVTIQPGEGTRIDATLALLKADMGEDLPPSFRPIVVADARYTLADGSEGRTSASFEIGVEPEEGGSLEPIELARASMHDNVGAELHGEPVHA